MKLLVKFNLLFLLVMLLGLGVSGVITKNLLEANAKDEVLKQATLLMEKALAVRGYTSGQITKLLQTQLKYEFLPQAIPSYSATEVLGALRSKYPDFGYKEATLNPTNPRDRAAGWEVDVVTQFRNDPGLGELSGQRDTPSGPSLWIARPLRITNPACLECHSSVEAAPKTMIDKYGPANGFGWQLHEVVGAQMVSVPMAVPMERSQHTWGTFMALFSAVFAATALALNVLLWALVIRPVTRMAHLAERVSLGEADVPPFAARGRDEIAVLGQSFTRMRRSLGKAMKLLEGTS